MFVLILTYKAPIEKVIELLEAHCCYLDKYCAPESFLLPGAGAPDGGSYSLPCSEPCRSRKDNR